MGNRSAKTDSSAGNESYGYDAANRLTSRTIGTTSHTVTSDANGNTLSDGTRSNTWDSQNRLVSCSSGVSGSTQTSAFTYGSDGLRRRGTVTASDGTSTRTDYIYDGTMMVEQVVQHFDGSGSAIDTPTTITYMQGPQGPLYRKSLAAADPSWYVYDGLGSVAGEVDVNGNLTASKEFHVYGPTRSVTGTPTTRQGFVGQLGHESDDETGLIYMQRRYCDPSVGRFISQDPARTGINWYCYADNDPVTTFDPSGKDTTGFENFFLAWLTDRFVEGIWSVLIKGPLAGISSGFKLPLDFFVEKALTGRDEVLAGGKYVGMGVQDMIIGGIGAAIFAGIQLMTLQVRAAILIASMDGDNGGFAPSLNPA